MKHFKYIFVLSLISSLSLQAHRNCFTVLLKKIKGESRNDESAHLLNEYEKRQRPDSQAVELLTIAQDPLRFARFIWGFELSFFDKN